MISAVYKNNMLYYGFMHDVLIQKFTHSEFAKKYQDQRSEDLDEDYKNGFYEQYSVKVAQLKGNYKIFEHQYSDRLYEEALSANSLKILAEYEKASQELNIRGEWFFMGIWNFIDTYVHEYHQSDDENFDLNYNIDERTLTYIIQVVYDLLTHNKSRWLLAKDGGAIEEYNDPSMLDSESTSNYENQDKQNSNTASTTEQSNKNNFIDVIHYFNPKTRIDVIVDTDGNLMDIWKLSVKQVEHLKATGRIGGGR